MVGRALIEIHATPVHRFPTRTLENLVGDACIEGAAIGLQENGGGIIGREVASAAVILLERVRRRFTPAFRGKEEAHG